MPAPGTIWPYYTTPYEKPYIKYNNRYVFSLRTILSATATSWTGNINTLSARFNDTTPIHNRQKNVLSYICLILNLHLTIIVLIILILFTIQYVLYLIPKDSAKSYNTIRVFWTGNFNRHRTRFNDTTPMRNNKKKVISNIY